MNKPTLVVGVIAIAALIMGFVGVTQQDTEMTVKEVVREIGAAVGPEHLQHQIFKAGHEYGGTWNATTTAGSATLQRSDLIGRSGPYRGLYVTQSTTADDTLTLMASSTLASDFTYSGASITFTIVNATTTVGTDLVIASGAGIDLEVASSTNTNLIIGPGDSADITLVRNSSSDATNPKDFKARFELYDDGD